MTRDAFILSQPGNLVVLPLKVDEPAEHGEHFLDILEPTIGAA